MIKKATQKLVAILCFSAFLFSSCDKDFNEVGLDVLGGNGFQFDLDDTKTVVAFSQSSGVVQSNNLPINTLGIYSNPIFGKTRASIVTQLQLAVPGYKFEPTLAPSGNVVLDSVVLSIPYFSTRTGVSASGAGTFRLDSIAGTTAMSLKVFQSGFYLNDFEVPNLNTAPKYFTDNNSVFKIGDALNDDIDPKQNIAFKPESKEFIVLKRDNQLAFVSPREVESRQTPRMNIRLNKSRFQQLIVNAPTGKLANNNIFKDYLRGLIFEVDDASDGSLISLDLTKGNVTLHYSEFSGLKENPANPAGPKIPITFDHDSNSATPEIPRMILKSMVLNLQGSSINIMQQTNTTNYANKIASGTPNQNNGDSRLYLKGGANGSVVFIDLFGKDLYGDNGVSGAPNNVPDELDIMRSDNILINEANLVFTVDNVALGTVVDEPGRLYLYDANNKNPLTDYFKDNIANTLFPKNNRPVYGGILKRKTKENGANGRGIEYKFRITNHIKNLIKFKDSTNVRLGLAVTESIATISNSMLKNSIVVPAPVPIIKPFDRVPTGSVMNQRGTILFGNNIPVGPVEGDYGKRLKLEIYYTKPKN